MAIERREISGDRPRIGWSWGLLLMTAVVGVGVVVSTAVLLLLGGYPTWPAAVMAAGFLIAWTAFIAVLRLGQRRAWRG
jgi:hypothetical protein